MKSVLERIGGWRRAGGAVFAVLTIAFLLVYLLSNLRELQAQQWTIRPAHLVVSLIVQIIGLLSGAWVWQLLLHSMGSPIAFLPAARIRFVSGLARYVPGKIWPFLGAAGMGAQYQIDAATTITSLIAHTIFTLLGALLVAAFTLPLAAASLGVNVGALRWASLLLLLLAHPAVISAALRLLGRITRRPVAEWHGSYVYGLWLVLLCVLGWLLNGAALFIFFRSMMPLPMETFTAVLGINAFAFMLGQVVFIAPAGLGAKEGAVAALMALYVSTPAAALLAIAARVWSTLGEILLVGMLMRSKDTPRPPGDAR